MNNDILKTIFVDDLDDIEAFEDDVELGLLEDDILFDDDLWTKGTAIVKGVCKHHTRQGQ